MPQEIGAWIHIGETGKITVYTGKVEIGQNIRTSLSQVVAEELRVGVDAIHLVMADTALTPFDAGTFGSGTTPRMASQLRRAAAATRELLLDLAADQAKVDRGALVVADAKVTHPPSQRTFTFAELTKGQKLTKNVAADISTVPAGEWKIAGTSAPKVDGRAIVTGKHRYTPDMKSPGMLHGKVLRPPTLNATLVSVDLKEAEAMTGVTAVHDGSFVGVAAPTLHQAEEALATIRAEWKETAQPSDKELFEELERLAHLMKLPVDVVNVPGADEDSEAFGRRKIPTLMVHSVTPSTWPILHTARDTLAAVDMTAYYGTYRLIAAYLADLDQKLR